MSFAQRYYLECDFCGNHFGGPNAGAYDPTYWAGPKDKDGLNGLFAHLLLESRDLGWIEVQYMADKAILCSPKCASEWILKPRTN